MFESHIRVGLGVVCGSPDLILRSVVVVEVGLGVMISAADIGFGHVSLLFRGTTFLW